MDALLLSRLQFAAATMFHFLFVPLTLGLSVLIAIMETRWVRTGDETYKRMAKFWGKIFLINFGLGVVTGITLEFQFGTNWSRYSMYVGDIFGSLLAIEATAAFFLESTFVAVWVFGWERISPKLHCLSIWLVAIAGNLSAIWIILANGFMQHPVGYVIRNGRAELESFWAVITNSFGWQQYLHVIFATLVLTGFFVMGVAAWHLLRKSNEDFFQRSFNMGAWTALIFSVLVAVQGHAHGNEVAETQPEKLAAMESLWETEKGAPMYLLLMPSLSGEGNMVEALPIPNMLSILAYSDPDATVKGLNDFPEADRPPVLITFLNFRAMVGLGTLFILVAAYGVWKRNKLQESRWYLKILPWLIPLPYIAIQAGWIVAEVGRQ
ncbi:MAG: cytochrome ubiquinol oxidase subunit I, partial [Desulfovibrionaceae bacterium]